MPEVSVTRLSGTERAAILLMALGEDEAAQVLRHMDVKEVQKVGAAMATLRNLSKDQVSAVLDDFVLTVEKQTALGVGSEEYIRKVMTQALGEEKAENLIDRILTSRKSKGIETLRWMEPRAVAEIIRMEHPQIIAIVLSHLDADHAAEVLSLLPPGIRPEVIVRIATLEGVQPSALQELDGLVEKTAAVKSKIKSSGVGGVRTAADILNYVEGDIEAELMEKLKEVDPDLSQEIQDRMFVFDNLVEVDDRGIQALLREVSSESLIVALKGSDEAVREKIFKNMSKRAAEMLRDDLEAKGPVRLSEVEAAQKEILAIARRMAEAGDLALGGKGEQYV